MLYLRIYVLLFLSVLVKPLAAQTSIGGIINSYAAVLNLDYCENKLGVNTTSGFQANQKVLMIQMKGAEISSNNNAQFGDITDYKGCGNYEINKSVL